MLPIVQYLHDTSLDYAIYHSMYSFSIKGFHIHKGHVFDHSRLMIFSIIKFMKRHASSL